MIKRKAILLIGLICFGFVNGPFTVICHGSDGHIAVELSTHNHCNCTETHETDDQDKSNDNEIDFSCQDKHCKDTFIISDFFITKQNNTKYPHSTFLTTNNFPESFSSNITFDSGYLITTGDHLLPFFTPLQMIILLV
jgi:hypothetical protein